MGIHLDQLRTFVAVAEAGGLTPAAETLNLSLPAISRRLTGLEDELGIHLLERSTRRLALTQTGREFLPRARRLLDELEESLVGIRETAARRRGLVTLACATGAHPVLVARGLVDPLIERVTGLILRQGLAPAPAAQALLDLLAERLARSEAARAGRGGA